MKLPTDAPIGTVVVHKKYGAGILRFNEQITQQGTDYLPGFPTRLVAVQFECNPQWRYLTPDTEFAEIMPSTSPDLARA